MRMLLCLFALVSAHGWAVAQDTVVPRGLGSIHTFGAGEKWDAEKSRRVVLIDKSQFPWGAGNPGVVHGFRVRRTGGIVVELQGVQKTVRVRISATQETNEGGSPVGPLASNPQLRLDDNHGAATPTTVFDSTFTYDHQNRIPVFYQGFAAAFSSATTFTTPFDVPADADTLVLDIEVAYPNGFSFDPAWWPEEVLPSSAHEYLGGFRRLSAPCPAVTCSDGSSSAQCMDRCNASGTHINSVFVTDFRVGSPNEPVFGWIGLIQAAPGFFPGIACPYHVDPSTCQFLGISDPFSTEINHIWGIIPNLPFLIGFPLGVQFAAFPTALSPDQGALSGAYELVIGPAPSNAVQFSTVEAVCDPNNNLGGVTACSPTNDPFGAGAMGAMGNTPILELF